MRKLCWKICLLLQKITNFPPIRSTYTTWPRLLRLYVALKNPPKNLRILVEFIIKCYVPMYFNIKYYSSVVYGSALFFKFISWSRFLEPNLRSIVNKVIEDNAYYAHSENILLSMLFDDRKEKRDSAIKKILRYRNDVEDPLELRVYKKPDINFHCTNYTDMIDLNDINNVFEPPFTRSIPYDTLKAYLNQDDSPFTDPKVPSHIQGTERHVQLLAAVSKRVLPENVEAVMATTLESRDKLPRLDSKKDLQQ